MKKAIMQKKIIRIPSAILSSCLVSFVSMNLKKREKKMRVTENEFTDKKQIAFSVKVASISVLSVICVSIA